MHLLTEKLLVTEISAMSDSHLLISRVNKVFILTVSVHLVDHVLQFGLCGVLAQRPHDGAELFGGDGAVAILVE